MVSEPRTSLEHIELLHQLSTYYRVNYNVS